MLTNIKGHLPQNKTHLKRTVLLAIYLFIFSLTNAQTLGENYISGTVYDSVTNAPLEYATVTLFIKNNSKPLTGTVTDKLGYFILKDIKDGVYSIVFEFIGYHSFSTKEFQLDKKHNPVEFKKILLSQQKINLESYTIIAQSKIIENKIDKMVFNAERDISSQSGVATDVLRKVPMVSIDVDGNVQLSGSSGIRFLLNGKPSTAFGSSITDVLQSIPASAIKSIEVITNPGAKYSASGLGGIINIILKTNKAKGYNGSLSLSAGTRIENGSFNFNVRNNNFGFNAFFNVNKKLNVETPTSSTRISNDSNKINTLLQYGSSMFERHSFQTGMGFDWTYKKLNSFTGAISYKNFGSNNNGIFNQSNQIFDGSYFPPVLSLMNNNNHFSFNNVDASLNYKRTFKKEDQELEIIVNNSLGNDHDSFNNTQKSIPLNSMFYGSNSNNPSRVNETSISVDYTEPVRKEVVFGAGSKVTLYNIKSRSRVSHYQTSTQLFEDNASLSNYLDYKQNVYAAYSEISFPVSTLFKTKIGMRYERTEINSFYSNAQKQSTIPGYNTLVPSIYFSKNIGEKEVIKLSYSKRIERPDYEDLNPFVNTNDPKNLSAGNSDLKPEIGHRIELAYSREIKNKGSVMVSLFYRINDHDIQPYIVFYSAYNVGDSVYYNVALNTRQNIGMEKNIGINLFGNVNLTSKLTVSGNVFLFRRHTINVLDDGYNYNSFNYRINMNSTYQFTNSLVAEFFGNFNSSRHEAQGKYPSYTNYSLAIRKQFWKKKGSLALTAINFFQENINQNTVLNGPGFSTNYYRGIPSRSIGVNFAWKFGKLEFKKSKSESDLNNNPSGE